MKDFFKEMGLQALLSDSDHTTGSVAVMRGNRTKQTNRANQKDKPDPSLLQNDTGISADDPEEGEIVDDYEFIISSDEEICLRQRIEETNEEREGIGKISYKFSSKYTNATRSDGEMNSVARCPFTPIEFLNSIHSKHVSDVADISSISSVEFTKAKKRKHRKSKPFRSTETEYNLNKPNSAKYLTDPNPYCRTKKHASGRYIYSKNSSLYSYYSSNREEFESDKCLSIVSRDELRFALGHSVRSETNCGNLKDRLENENIFKKTKKDNEGFSEDLYLGKNPSAETILEKHHSSSDSVSLEEQELRLIALKSAVMKKHFARKKRDAEEAYSPTDFDDMFDRSVFTDDEMEVVEVEMENMDSGARNNMEMSPVLSPKLYLNSKKNYCNEIRAQVRANEFNSTENTKLVDMDIANSDSEEELLPGVTNKNWQPLNRIPALVNNYTYLETDTHSITGHSKVDIESTNYNFRESGVLNENRPANVFYLNDDVNSFFNSGEKNISQPLCTDISTKDEDEDSLRTFLLSKLSSSQACKSIFNTNTQGTLLPKVFSPEDGDDPEILRSFLLQSMSCRKSQEYPAKSILKEAVRRLQRKSYPQYKTTTQHKSKGVKTTNKDCTVLNRSSVAVSLDSIDNEEILTKGDIEVLNKLNEFQIEDKHIENKCKRPITSLEYLNECRRNVSDYVEICSSNCENQKMEKCIDNKREAKTQQYGRFPKKFLPSTKIDPKFQNKHASKPYLKNLHKIEDTISNACLSYPGEKNHEFRHINQRRESESVDFYKINAYPKEDAIKSNPNSEMQPHVHVDTVFKNRDLLQNQIPEDKILNPTNLNSRDIISKKKSSVISNSMLYSSEPTQCKNDSALSVESHAPVSRFISSTDVPKVQVKKLVITLRASDTETSDDDEFNTRNSELRETTETGCNSIDSIDNGTTLCLLMESRDDILRRARSPSKLIPEIEPFKSDVSDCFKRKLDNFLKTMRSQVEQSINPTIGINEKLSTGILKNLLTPAAVKHLPYPSQQEYRRLVHRMRMLEKQKQAKRKSSITITQTSYDHSKPIVAEKNASRNDNKTSALALPIASPRYNSKFMKTNNSKQIPKSDMLREYESYYLKTGACIVSSLEKSLQLVLEAKKIKKAKLCYQERLRQLQSEIVAIKQKLNCEQKRMSTIFPKICESNQKITTLKQRHNKLFKSAYNLGKIIKGDKYRCWDLDVGTTVWTLIWLNSDIRQQITLKSKILAKEIKIINSMRCTEYEDVADKTSRKINKFHLEPKKKNFNDSLQFNKTPSRIKSNVQMSEFNFASLLEARKALKGFDTAKCDISNGKETNITHSDEQCLQITDQNNDLTDNGEVQELIAKSNADFCHLGENNKIKLEERNLLEHTGATNIGKKKIVCVRDYISPLGPLKTEKRISDPNAIICRYNLLGQCKDESCNYEHIRNSTV